MERKRNFKKNERGNFSNSQIVRGRGQLSEVETRTSIFESHAINNRNRKELANKNLGDVDVRFTETQQRQTETKDVTATEPTIQS